MLPIHGRCFGKVAFKEHCDFHQLKKLWATAALEAFEATVRQECFPCFFGTRSVRSGSFEFLFISEQAPVTDFIAGLGNYIEQTTSWSMKLRIRKPLIILFERNNFSSLAEEQRYAWRLLQQLHDKDPAPWPESIPLDIYNEHWSFSFMGMPLFINMSFPGHQLMKSRNLGTHIVFVINPRENFDYVASGGSQKGQRIRARIRSRSEAYNAGRVSGTLGAFGEHGNLEIKQYQLEEPGSLSHAQCPFHMNLNPTAAKASIA
jgi:FPC/CPF motif-containing protein YcgG